MGQPELALDHVENSGRKEGKRKKRILAIMNFTMLRFFEHLCGNY